MMTKKQISKKRNASFVVDIKSQENHTWQGRLTWVEEQESQNFRSALELINLMNSVLLNEEDQNL